MAMHGQKFSWSAQFTQPIPGQQGQSMYPQNNSSQMSNFGGFKRGQEQVYYPPMDNHTQQQGIPIQQPFKEPFPSAQLNNQSTHALLIQLMDTMNQGRRNSRANQGKPRDERRINQVRGSITFRIFLELEREESGFHQL